MKRSEVERCQEIYALVELLVKNDRQDLFPVVKELCDLDSPSIKKSFEVAARLYRKVGCETVFDWMRPMREQIIKKPSEEG